MHGGMALGHRGMALGHRGMALGHRGMALGHRGMALGVSLKLVCYERPRVVSSKFNGCYAERARSVSN